MKRRGKKQALAEVRRILEKWRGQLFLQEWYFDLQYCGTDEPASGELNTLASVHVNTVYLKAIITIYPAWLNRTQKVREHAIVHELCHCLTQDAWNLAGKMRDGLLVTENEIRETIEKLTQRISYVAMRGEWRKNGDKNVQRRADPRRGLPQADNRGDQWQRKSGAQARE